MHTNPETFTHESRYGKNITVPEGYESDGATGGLDVCKRSFFTHDWLCGSYTGKGPKPTGGRFDDGTKCTNWQASTIHSDLLRDCGLHLMVIWRWPITFTFGGGEARKNGMFKLRDKQSGRS